MALQPSNIPLNIKGLDTKTDSRQQDLGEMTELSNVRYDNYPMIRKRYGYEDLGAMPPTFPVNTPHYAGSFGRFLGALHDEVVAGDGARLYGFSERSGFIDRGQLRAMGLSTVSIAKDTSNLSCPGVAYHSSGIAIYTWIGALGLAYYQVVDVETNTILLTSAIPNSGGTYPVRVKPHTVGDKILIFLSNAGGNLYCLAVPMAVPGVVVTATTVLATGLSAAGLFDVDVYGASAYAVYYKTSNYLYGVSITSGMIVGAETPIVAAVATQVGIYANGGIIWAGWEEGGILYSMVVTLGFAVSVPKTTTDATPGGAIRNIIGGWSDWTGGGLIYEVTGAATTGNYVKLAGFTGAQGALGFAGSLSTVSLGVGLASRAVEISGMVHFLVAYDSALQSTIFLMDLIGGVHAKVAPGTAGGYSAITSQLPDLIALTSTTFLAPYESTDRLFSVGGNIFTQSGINAVTFDLEHVPSVVQAADNLLISGAIVSLYDGETITEYGFSLYPENVTVTASGSGTLSGDYYCCAVYEWMDAQGNLHQSSPSPVVKVTASAAAAFNWTVPNLRVTRKANVSVVLYRTTQTIRGVMFRVTSPASPIIGPPTADQSTWIESIADATLIGNAQLVFNPLNSAAELPPLAPPAAQYVTRYRNRLVMVPAEEPGTFQFSKAMMPGVPVEWNPLNFFQATNVDNEPIVALGELDDKLIILKSDRLLFTAGDGPAPNGTGNDYGNPQRIPGDSGCINPRSVIVSPAGLFYQSQKGIMLLGRNLSPSYAGRDVEDYNATTITSARIVPTARRIIFTLDSGVALALDYDVGFWSTWSNVNAADGIVHRGSFLYLQANGALRRETPGLYVDPGGVPVLIGVQFGWFNFAGQNGAQRVWRLIIRGDYRTPHKLEVYIGYDNSSAFEQREMIDASTLVGNNIPLADTGLAGTQDPGGGLYPQYEWQIKLLRQRSTNIQVTVREAAGSPPGEGLSLSSFTVLCGIQPGLHKVPAERSSNTNDYSRRTP
jgi:hypothetical protein